MLQAGLGRIRLHNAALGSAPGQVRMTDADTLSRVVAVTGSGGTPAPETQASEIGLLVAERITLDSLTWDFLDSRVSIFKLDVDGSEPDAIRGAHNLLSAQAIDVIYVEAGLSSAPVQQSYYRTVEHLLAGYGYRIFGIYEQTNAWPADSPLLHRINLGFMSEGFAANNQHRLSRELNVLQEKVLTEMLELRARVETSAAEIEVLHARLQRSHEAAEAEIARADAETARADAAEGMANANKTALAAAIEAAERAAQAAATAQAERDALSSELRRLLDYGRWLEKRHADTLASNSWRALEPLRWISRQLKRRRPVARFKPTLGAPEVDPQKASEANRLDDKLWGGFSATALPELEAIASDSKRARIERSEAGFAIARWRHSHGDFAAALAAVQAARRLDTRNTWVQRVVLLEADCLMRLDRTQDARDLLDQALERRPKNIDLQLAFANCLLDPDGSSPPGADASRLQWINRIYIDAHLAPLALHRSDRPLGIDNLTTLPVPAEDYPEHEPRISVIMPVYAAAETLAFRAARPARSELEQSRGDRRR